MTDLAPIGPREAAERQAGGALLIDIRGADEFARRHIPGSTNLVPEALPAGAREVIYLCRSGNRTAVNADRLACPAGGRAFMLHGGLEAWARTGLPIQEDRRQPLELMRQVQIAAGLLVLSGVLLGVFASPVFFALSAFVGAGLTFAGLTGWCGMARLLAAMPWNRPVAIGS
ncbi:hypothetical protein B5C34_02555 [Pacificimonas flava]|uniref:Rhodanese domain-containing protein n=2 Tax=Pacificimonas TaxID=1960290 RepID=A0A219B2P3_9SPHN|nr:MULTISPECIES: rhodanese family protein [Pacificimonas]MBZ6377898.1 rhodanese family protein [Pacificimonas aurantium]OWV32444.1 hypothetical protein B5C34_02555 [Pacificimonas flava]